MAGEPNLNFGTPTIFFDSHPHEQESYLYSYVSSLKSTLWTAWSGDVPPFHSPGQLRLIWYTHDGKKGSKDFDLHEYAFVRDKFDVLLDLEDVRRVVIMGYSGQNPYVLAPGGRNEWVDRFGKEKARGMTAAALQYKAGYTETEEEQVKRVKETTERLDGSKEGRTGTLVDIEAVIEQSDRVDEEKRKEREEKIWKENESLLSGEMV